jgi:phosphatidate cytidylyltransferase
MKKLVQRLLIFFIGIPAVFALVFFLPFCRHLPLNIVVILFSGIGAVEFSTMLGKKQLHISKTNAFLLGALAPAALTLNISLNFPEWLTLSIIMAGAVWILLSGVFLRPEKMETVINHIAGGFSLLVYPGFFMYWLVKMSGWDNSEVILLFLLIIFGNDSLAWLSGTLFGKNNRGIFTASPNKSIAGFAGGLFGSIIFSAGAAFLFPSVFARAENITAFAVVVRAIVLGVFTSLFAILGDLAESAIKRSCDFKDSGTLMLGRGGILDSIDSIAVAAPVFYFLYSLFFISS